MIMNSLKYLSLTIVLALSHFTKAQVQMPLNLSSDRALSIYNPAYVDHSTFQITTGSFNYNLGGAISPTGYVGAQGVFREELILKVNTAFNQAGAFSTTLANIQAATNIRFNDEYKATIGLGASFLSSSLRSNNWTDNTYIESTDPLLWREVPFTNFDLYFGGTLTFKEHFQAYSSIPLTRLKGREDFNIQESLSGLSYTHDSWKYPVKAQLLVVNQGYGYFSQFQCDLTDDRSNTYVMGIRQSSGLLFGYKLHKEDYSLSIMSALQGWSTQKSVNGSMLELNITKSFFKPQQKGDDFSQKKLESLIRMTEKISLAVFAVSFSRDVEEINKIMAELEKLEREVASIESDEIDAEMYTSLKNQIALLRSQLNALTE